MLKYLKVLICFLLLLVSYSVYAEDFGDEAATTSKLEQRFLGIQLGCSIDELKAALTKPKYPIKLIKKWEEDGVTRYVFTGNHRLKGATGTMFSFWKGKLMLVGVFLQGADAEDVYDALQRLATKKYGEMTDEIVFSGKECRVAKGDLFISLRYKPDSIEDDSTFISALHLGIGADMDDADMDDEKVGQPDRVTITNLNGTVYERCKITRVELDGITVVYAKGVTKIPFPELPEEYRKEYKAVARKRADAAARKRAAAATRKRAAAAKERAMRKAMFRPSGMSVEAFHAMRPTSPVVFSARAHLSDYFNYEFGGYDNPEARYRYWSVDLRTSEGRNIGNGYILKQGRGEALFDLIKDGKWHSVIVRIRYPLNSEDSGVFYLDDFQTVGSTDEF